MSQHIQVTGLKKVQADLKTLAPRAVVAITEANKEAAETIASEARSAAPRKTGALIGSIRVGATKTSASVRAGGAKVPYAAPIHWGWPQHGISPQPFLYNALDSRRGEVIEAYKARVDEIIHRPGRV